MKRGSKPKGIAAASKKRKAEAQAEALSGTPLADALLTAGAVAAAGAVYKTARPVRHAVLTGVCKEERLRAVFQQALHGLSADLCESDTSKVYQGADLAALDADKGELVQVRALRDALYSNEMREMVSAVAKCGPLSPAVDCNATILNEGCHLLPHALLPSKGRRVAFFLFLTPDEEWSEEDGATLDLYGTISPPADAKSAGLPERSILPQWNSMVLLDIDGAGEAPVVGISEVVSEDKTLMCFAGWYRLLEPAEASPSLAPAAAPVEGFRTVRDSAGKLSATDKQLLGKYIAPHHLEEETIAAICQEFEDDSAAQLREFLLPRYGILHLVGAGKEEEGVGDGERPITLCPAPDTPHPTP